MFGFSSPTPILQFFPIFTLSAIIALSITVPSSIYDELIMMESLTTAPGAIYTPVPITELLTLPYISEASPIIDLSIDASSDTNCGGILSLFV